MFSPTTYGVVFNDPTQNAANTVKLNQMVSDVNAAGFGDIDWGSDQKCHVELLAPFQVPVRWRGVHKKASILVTNQPTGDVLRFNETVEFTHMGMNSTVIRMTGGVGVNLAGTNVRKPGSVTFEGEGSVVEHCEIKKQWLGIKNTGWWNTVRNVSIYEATDYKVSAFSGGVWQADGALAMTDCITGNQIETALHQPEFGVRLTRGQINMHRVNGFLSKGGFLCDPGDGDIILIYTLIDCAFDTTQETSFMVRPRHVNAQVHYGYISNSWFKPGWNGGAGYSMVFDNAVGAVMRKAKVIGNIIGTYAAGAGCGLYVNMGGTQKSELIVQGNQIGEDGFGFPTGILLQAGTNKLDITGNLITRCSVGASVAAGCDGYRMANSYDGCSAPVIDPNPAGSTRIQGPNAIY